MKFTVTEDRVSSRVRLLEYLREVKEEHGLTRLNEVIGMMASTDVKLTEHNSRFNRPAVSLDDYALYVMGEHHGEYSALLWDLATSLGVIPDNDDRFAAMKPLFPILEKWVVSPCRCRSMAGPRAFRVESLIIHLNDRDGWSRERIAKWVEDLEEKVFKTAPE
jgi:hypothetical protein